MFSIEKRNRAIVKFKLYLEIEWFKTAWNSSFHWNRKFLISHVYMNMIIFSIIKILVQIEWNRISSRVSHNNIFFFEEVTRVSLRQNAGEIPFLTLSSINEHLLFRDHFQKTSSNLTSTTTMNPLNFTSSRVIKRETSGSEHLVAIKGNHFAEITRACSEKKDVSTNEGDE